MGRARGVGAGVRQRASDLDGCLRCFRHSEKLFGTFNTWRRANAEFRKEIRDELYSVSQWFNPRVM